MRRLIVPLTYFTRAVNVSLGGSFSETLSSRAHRLRLTGKPRLANGIDALFFWQDSHCQSSHARWKPKA